MTIKSSSSAFKCSVVMTRIEMLMFSMNWAVVLSSSVDARSLSFTSAPDGHKRTLIFPEKETSNSCYVAHLVYQHKCGHWWKTLTLIRTRQTRLEDFFVCMSMSMYFYGVLRGLSRASLRECPRLQPVTMKAWQCPSSSSSWHTLRHNQRRSGDECGRFLQLSSAAVELSTPWSVSRPRIRSRRLVMGHSKCKDHAGMTATCCPESSKWSC